MRNAVHNHRETQIDHLNTLNDFPSSGFSIYKTPRKSIVLKLQSVKFGTIRRGNVEMKHMLAWTWFLERVCVCVFKTPADWDCKHETGGRFRDHRPTWLLKLGNPNSDLHRSTPSPLLYIFVQKYTEKIIKRFLSLSVKSLHLNIKNKG